MIQNGPEGFSRFRDVNPVPVECFRQSPHIFSADTFCKGQKGIHAFFIGAFVENSLCPAKVPDQFQGLRQTNDAAQISLGLSNGRLENGQLMGAHVINEVLPLHGALIGAHALPYGRLALCFSMKASMSSARHAVILSENFRGSGNFPSAVIRQMLDGLKGNMPCRFLVLESSFILISVPGSKIESLCVLGAALLAMKLHARDVETLRGVSEMIFKAVVFAQGSSRFCTNKQAFLHRIENQTFSIYSALTGVNEDRNYRNHFFFATYWR